jgi:protein-L-isoaspartate(D-aspartate) O-methyltransferase
MVADQLVARGISSPDVLAAMSRVPRERFVEPALAGHAYDDAALGIASGQTISQPYMVARMTELLDLPGWRSRHAGRIPRVLDVGTGSGYQAAILVAMGARVIGVERIAELAAAAELRLRDAGFAATVVTADGSEGWPDQAPYAGIVVAAAAPSVPQPLVDQLATDGRLVIPVGRRDHQRLQLVRRVRDRQQAESVESCVFVPLVGRYGFPPREA